jgi:hypothetical protein
MFICVTRPPHTRKRTVRPETVRLRVWGGTVFGRAIHKTFCVGFCGYLLSKT